jgi:hypothetical protein
MKKFLIYLSIVVAILSIITVIEVKNPPSNGYIYKGYSEMPIELALKIVNEQNLDNNAIVAVSDDDTVYLSYHFTAKEDNSYGLVPTETVNRLLSQISTTWYAGIMGTLLIYLFTHGRL